MPPFRSSLPLQQVPEEQMSPDLDQRIRHLLCDCFPTDAPVFSKTRHWHGTSPHFSLVHESEGVITGHVGVVLRDIRVMDQEVKIAGIQNLAVHPDWRKSGLSRQLMRDCMEEARKRKIPFGLLFCVPELEKFYTSLEWKPQAFPAFMRDEQNGKTPIPGKNICMTLGLAGIPFPPGEIDLQGADW